MSRRGLRAWFLVIVALALPACATHLNGDYARAVRAAAIVRTMDVAHDLIAVVPTNTSLVWNPDRTKVLVVTWSSQSSYDRFLKPATRTSPDEAHVVWVTAVPQLQQFCQRFLERARPTPADLTLRLKQYLGLNVEWAYDVFVEMWVAPQDLFRPCVDPEVTDATCDVEFKTPAPSVNGIADYPRFYKNLYFSDFRSMPGVPWTGLGYTYDWGNPRSREGASEFIISPGASYDIKAVTPTAQYCR